MIHASIVIPTKNSMPRFERVLGMVLRQKTPWPFEIIVIDSGSTDGTVAYAEAHEKVRVISIDPKEFGHGRTRNQAIAEATGEFVALLTDDAEPVEEHWLQHLVAAVEQDKNVAGAFGRHVAYPHASPFMKRDLEAHFAGFLAHPLIVNKALDPVKYDRDVGWRQFLHFYSDNNSCLRKSVWKDIPYPDVEYAEEQLWAKRIIEEGYSKAYAPKAVVYHSHEYGIVERFQRSFDEAASFKKIFGYKLGESLGQCIISGWLLSKRDIQYYKTLRKHGIKSRLVRQCLLNVAHVAGHYFGTRHSFLPGRIARRFSLDRRRLEGH